MQTTELLRKVRRIEIRTSHLVSDVLAGQFRSAFKGRGMDFDEVAAYVQQQCEALGLEIKPSAHTAGQLKCVAWCTRRAAEDKDVFRLVLAMGAELSTQDQMPVAERLLEGLWLLNAKCGEGLADKRLTKRLREKGASVLLAAANRAAAAYVGGGAKVWARGMLTEVNKGLQRKFSAPGLEE